MAKALGAALARPSVVRSGRWVMAEGESGWPSAVPITRIGRLARSLARSGALMTTAAPPSLSSEQSSRRSGSEIMRLDWWSSMVIGVRIVALDLQRGVVAGGDRDFGQLAGGGAVELHVAAGHRGVELGGGDGAQRHLELADGAELGHLLDAGADAAAGVAGAAEREQDVLADAGLDDGEGALDGGDRGGAAHRGGGGKPQVLDAEIGDEVFGDGAVAVGDQAVDVGWLQAGVADGVQRGFKLEGQRGAVGAAQVFGFTDAGDGACFVQR